MTGGDTEHTRAAKQLAQERGLKLVLFGGGNLEIRQNGGTTASARAYIIGDRVYVRADHPRYTSEQLMRHEAGHDRIAKGEINPNTVRARIGAEWVHQISRMYAEAYEGSGMTAEEIWEEIICDSLADMNIFSEQESAETAAEFLEETKKASSVAEAEQTRGPPERDISTVGTMSRETKWHPDLTRNQLERLRQWVKYDIKISTNSIGQTANWTFRMFDGMPVFAIYSTENQSDPTILYEVKGAQAEYEREYLKNILERINYGESVDGKPRIVDRVLGRSWLRKAGSHPDDNGAVVRGSGSGNAGVLRKQSRRKPGAAFESVLRNLLQNKTDGVEGRTSQEPTQGTHVVPSTVSHIQEHIRQEQEQVSEEQSNQIDFFYEENTQLEVPAEIDAEAFLYGLDSPYERSGSEYQKSQLDVVRSKNSNPEEVEKYGAIRYHEDGTVVVTDDWTMRKHPKLYKEYRPNAIVDTVSQAGRQRDRMFYDEQGRQSRQISNGPHGNEKKHPYGFCGEHAHDIIWEGDEIVGRPLRELTDQERKENADIL